MDLHRYFIVISKKKIFFFFFGKDFEKFLKIFFFSFLRVKNFDEKIFFLKYGSTDNCHIDHAEHAKNKIRAELVFSAKFFFEIFFFA